jgi:hypothetical protein
MQVLKPTFCNVRFDSSVCEIYSTKEKVDLFFGDAFENTMIFMYIYIHVYFIKFSNEKVGLNTILTSQFQTYLFPIFIIPIFLKICSWFIINPIEGSIVSKLN